MSTKARHIGNLFEHIDREQGLKCKPVGRVPAAVRSAYIEAHQEVAA